MLFVLLKIRERLWNNKKIVQNCSLGETGTNQKVVIQDNPGQDIWKNVRKSIPMKFLHRLHVFYSCSNVISHAYTHIHSVKSVQILSFFCSVFSRIRNKYGEIRGISPYSVRMRENTDQKYLHIGTLFKQWYQHRDQYVSTHIEIYIHRTCATAHICITLN